jgi:uncharacterized protein DUF3168
MTARAVALKVRQQTVIRLRATEALTEITTADRVFGEQPDSPPEKPFVRHGVSDALPRRSSCWNGKTIDFPMHSFSKEKFTDEVHLMNDLIEEALDGAVIDLGGDVKATLEWLSSTVLRDAGDPNAWHGITRFRATI